MNLKKNGRCLFDMFKAYSAVSYLNDTASIHTSFSFIMSDIPGSTIRSGIILYPNSNP